MSPDVAKRNQAPSQGPNGDPPEPPPLPDPSLDLQSFPEILEWLIGTHYHGWAVRTCHPSSSYEPGDRPSCALMARVLLSVGDLPGCQRRSPLESTYADALQQLRTRSARRLPEECVERAVLALHLSAEWRGLLEEKAREWDSGKASRTYRKGAVERAIGATIAPASKPGAAANVTAAGGPMPPSTDPLGGGASRWAVPRKRMLAVIALAVLVLAAAVGIAAKWNAPGADTSGATSQSPPSKIGAGGGAAPVSPGEMREYLLEMQNLMSQAGHGRLRITGAISSFQDGKATKASTVQIIQTVIDNRNAAIAALSAVSVPPDARAAACQAAFRKALQYSVRADESYLDYVAGWASLAAARPDNLQARRWKRRFVAMFNDLAAEHGLSHDWSMKDF